jgi:hypothetical protein
MPILRGTAIIEKVSGIDKDASVNVWHFETVGIPSAADIQGVGDGLIAFYQAIQSLFPNNVASGVDAHRIEISQVTPGLPGEADDTVSALIGTRIFQMQTGAAFSLPNEVAACLSFRASIAGFAEESGLIRPRARRRGRVFIGPLDLDQVAAIAPNNEPRFSLTGRELMLDGYDALTTATAAVSVNLRHGVYSRTNGDIEPVEQVSCDSEFDTMRSRGRKPETRMSRPVVQGVAVAGRSGTDVALAA